MEEKKNNGLRRLSDRVLFVVQVCFVVLGLLSFLHVFFGLVPFVVLVFCLGVICLFFVFWLAVRIFAAFAGKGRES